MEELEASISTLHIDERKSKAPDRKSPSKQHRDCKKILTDLNVIYTEEVRYSTLKDVKKLPCDFQIIIDGMVCIIEVDGEQHFGKVDRFQKSSDAFNRQVYHDYIKVMYCKTNYIHMLKISYREKGLEEAYIRAFIGKVRSPGIIRPIIMFSNIELYKNCINLTDEQLAKQRSLVLNRDVSDVSVITFIKNVHITDVHERARRDESSSSASQGSNSSGTVLRTSASQSSSGTILQMDKRSKTTTESTSVSGDNKIMNANHLTVGQLYDTYVSWHLEYYRCNTSINIDTFALCIDIYCTKKIIKDETLYMPMTWHPTSEDNQRPSTGNFTSQLPMKQQKVVGLKALRKPGAKMDCIIS
jgi:hypothetical protein